MGIRKISKAARQAVAAAVQVVCCGTALAQEAAPAPVQEAAAAPQPGAAQTVVVSGTRASLARSLELKRNAAVVQDSISATELGRFPDENVADSLSHINGISITRTAGGEGQYVGVRGLGPGYNIVTLNDRLLATDGNGRDFAFDVLPADVISGADVLKSAQASQVEGSIGGTVNLRSARPLDNPGRHLGLRAEVSRNDMSRLNGRKFSAVYSDSTEDRRFGVLVGAVLSSAVERTDALNYNTYDTANPGSFDLNGDGQIGAGERDLVAPCCIAFGSTFDRKKRWALSTAIEWKPSDGLHLVLDALSTRLRSPQVGYNEAYYVQYAPGRWSDVRAANGLITDMTVHDFVPEVANITVDRVVATRQLGLNATWKPAPTLTLRGDVYNSRSVRDEGGRDTFVVSGIAGDNTLSWHANPNALPDIHVTLADGRDLAGALARGELGDADYGLHYVGLSGDNIRDTVNGLTLSGRKSFETGRLSSIDFGLATSRRDKRRDFIGNDWTNGSCQYCDMYGTTFASLGAQVVSPMTLPNFMPQAGGSFPQTFMRFDVPAYLDALRKLDGQPILDANGQPTGQSFDFANTLPTRDPTNSYRVRERTVSAWLQANLDGDDWAGNVGLRVVHTSTRSATAIHEILAVDDPTPDVPTSSPVVTYSDPVPVAESAGYTRLLPSANLGLWLSPKLQLRLAAAKVMARPSLDKLAATRSDDTVNRVYTLTIAGSAGLKPTTATQEDVSLEWYYKPKSALTAAVFAKQVSDFVTTQTTLNVDIGVPGRLYTVVSPINGDRGRVAGLELGWQHLFDNGFGLRAQHTRNQSKAWIHGEYVGELEGVAPATSSLGVFYERSGLGASVSLDRTGGYVVNHSTEAGWPNRAEPLTWVTASASYEFDSGLKLLVEGKNLSNAVYRSTLGRPDAVYGYSAWGRTVTLGASFRL